MPNQKRQLAAIHIGLGKNEDRILILEQVRGSQLSTEAVVTLNWFEEIKKLAPVQ